jgi:hypothetical protein
MFRLQIGGRPPSRDPRTWRGKKSLRFDVNTALRFLFYPSGGLRRHRWENASITIRDGATMPSEGRQAFFLVNFLEHR